MRTGLENAECEVEFGVTMLCFAFFSYSAQVGRSELWSYQDTDFKLLDCQLEALCGSLIMFSKIDCPGVRLSRKYLAAY